MLRMTTKSRNRFLAWTLIGGLISGAISASAEATANKREHGSAVVEGSDKVDFGAYRAIEKKVARYVIRNAGNSELRILKIRKTCGCASATANRSVLGPGEEATAEVVILPNSIFGLYSKNTFVETDDPGNRFVKLTVAGNAIPLVRVLPKDHIHAGRLKTGQSWSHAFTLKPTESGVVLGEPLVESTFPVEASLTGKNAEYSLALSLQPVATGGDLRCSVSVPVITPTNQPPIKASVTAKIGTQLTAVPGLVRLPRSDTPQARTFRFHVLGQRSRQLRPEELMLPDRPGVAFDTRQAKNGRWLVVEATFSTEFLKQLMAESSIPLTFTVPGASSADVICQIRQHAR